MLYSYSNAVRKFNFTSSQGDPSSGNNTFTIMVGRNGTGKSRLLRSVVTNLLRYGVDHDSFTREERINLNSEPDGELDLRWSPTRIICASTSPFDRFPLPRRDQTPERYSYLGLRGLPSANLGLSYMSRVMFSLLNAVHESLDQAESIESVLCYLGYEGRMSAILQLAPTRFIDVLLETSDPVGLVHEFVNRSMMPFLNDNAPGLNTLRTLTEVDLREVIDAARQVFIAVRSRRLSITVSRYGLSLDSMSCIDINNVLLLARSGLFRLREVVLHRREFEKPIKLHDASSGEQAVVMGLLGIGSHITDGSLICIDEPEVCLHPEWQEKYIELLFNTFRQYRGCHFLVATHSPQIVAQIPQGNCYVMSMEDGIARNANDYSQRSIDFQLAEVFNAPGFRNEYLSRIALNAFARVSKTKRFDEQSRGDLVILRRMVLEMRTNDPLLDLIAALEEMASAYE